LKSLSRGARPTERKTQEVVSSQPGRESKTTEESIMAIRLGEILIQKGIINEEQLRKALNAQLIYGGHLGTCLIELGYVDDRRLGETLAETLHVDYARFETLLDVGRDVIEVVPKKLVEKHLVVPFDLHQRVLQVAMVDPRNCFGIDELSFASGYKVQPFVSPELVILHFMDRYYEIPRERRYICLAKALERAAREAQQAHHEPQEGQSEIVASDPPDTPPEPATEERAASSPEEAIREPETTSDGNLVVHWVKRVKTDGQRRGSAWCDLFNLRLDHGHFDNLRGVYVVWHLGRDPVLRVGQGDIREQLGRIQQDQSLQMQHQESSVYVTWAPVPQEIRDGVEGYLMQMLNPAMGGLPAAPPIPVNLPT
jgi:hypothetical protein